MEFSVNHKLVINASEVRPFIESRLSQLTLQVSKIQSILNHLQESAFSTGVAVFQEVLSTRQDILNSLKSEILHYLPEDSGNLLPSVVYYNTLLEEMTESAGPCPPEATISGTLPGSSVNELMLLFSRLHQVQGTLQQLETDTSQEILAQQKNLPVSSSRQEQTPESFQQQEQQLLERQKQLSLKAQTIAGRSGSLEARREQISRLVEQLREKEDTLLYREQTLSKKGSSSSDPRTGSAKTECPA